MEERRSVPRRCSRERVARHMGRAFELRDAGQLDHGLMELWVVGGATLLALMCLAWSFYLTVRAEDMGA